MTPIIHFKCRTCERELAITPSTEHVTCPGCNAQFEIFVNDSIIHRRLVTTCVSCGHDALYVQKDFNRQVGIAIVVLGILASIYFFARSQPMFAMGALGLTALIDFLAHFWVGEVTVCYSC